MSTLTNEELVVQTIAASMSTTDWEILRTYFYKQFFDYLEVKASTPDLGKSYAFEVTVKNLNVGDPVTGMIKTVSTGSQLCYYNGDDWETIDTFQTVADFSDSLIDTSKIIYNVATNSIYKYIDGRWMKLAEFKDIIKLS
jgi:hypothetical protein